MHLPHRFLHAHHDNMTVEECNSAFRPLRSRPTGFYTGKAMQPPRCASHPSPLFAGQDSVVNYACSHLSLHASNRQSMECLACMGVSWRTHLSGEPRPLRLQQLLLLLNNPARAMGRRASPQSTAFGRGAPAAVCHNKQHDPLSYCRQILLAHKTKGSHAESKWIAVHAPGMHGELSLCMPLSSVASRVSCCRCPSHSRC